MITCILAKPPRPGHAKTRLIPALGACGAARLAHALLLDTFRAVQATAGLQPVLSTTDVTAKEWRQRPSSSIWCQGDGDLGARIERSLRRALHAAGPGAIAVGGDSLDVMPARLRQAVVLLERADAVLGPCLDGGFYLLALRRCPERLLEGLPWSARDTCARTHDRLEAHGMRVARLPIGFDVDGPVELERLLRSVARGTLRAPHTIDCLRELGLCPTTARSVRWIP